VFLNKKISEEHSIKAGIFTVEAGEVLNFIHIKNVMNIVGSLKELRILKLEVRILL
jgi:hypothetical protein